MARYWLRRLLQTIPTVLGVTLVIFVLVRVVPGDPAGLLFPTGQVPSAEVLAEIRREMGLDRPIVVQFVAYLAGLIQGDLGYSYRTNSSVLDQILRVLPATLELALGAILVAILVGITAGVIAALKQYSIFDYGTIFVASIGMSAPVFWTGLFLILIFAVNLGWFPAGGRTNPRGTGGVADQLHHLVLPSLALGFNGAAILARVTRSCILDVISRDYITTARAKGLAERAVLARHTVRNALLPIVTVMGLQLGYLLGGAVLTEAVFNREGLGTLLVSAIFARDYPVVQGVVLFVSVSFVLVNLLVDVLYGMLDPRVRHG